MSTQPATLRIPPRTTVLPDNAQWTNRFEIPSETSDRIYVVSQHKHNRHWGCSCPAWRIRRECKHLRALALPAHERPLEVAVARG